MAQKAMLGVEGPITLATTVTQLVVVNTSEAPKTIVLWESDVDVYVVATSLAGVADGGTLPDLDRRKVPAAVMPAEVSIAGKRFIGLAGEDAGTARFELLP